jgi:hypothetical protein
MKPMAMPPSRRAMMMKIVEFFVLPNWCYTAFHPFSSFTPILLTTDCTDKTDYSDV